jgi:uncharacterized repeat protein (TIGR03803 family)
MHDIFVFFPASRATFTIVLTLTEVLLMQNTRLSIGTALTIAVLAVNLLMLGSRAAAQTETVLYSFTSTGSAGIWPNLTLAFDSAGNLYGTTTNAVFKLTPNSSGGWTSKTLHVFRGIPDGATPAGGVVLDAAGNIYGLTTGGGRGNGGTAYELVRSATGQYTEKILHHFGLDQDGHTLFGTPILDAAGNLFGTTQLGGTNNAGTVFELIATALGPWTEKILYSFSLNGDGTSPMVGVIFDGAGNLYGTTGSGGANSGGTVYQLSPHSDGSWTETILYSFALQSEPDGSLILDKAGNIYGATINGGAHGVGVVYELSPQTDGSWAESILHNFNANGTDGFNAFTGMIFDRAGNLYGATMSGGVHEGLNGKGTIFRLTPQSDGSWTESMLFSFNGANGESPQWGQLIMDASGSLYGGAKTGGANGDGAIFKITP